MINIDIKMCRDLAFSLMEKITANLQGKTSFFLDSRERSSIGLV